MTSVMSRSGLFTIARRQLWVAIMAFCNHSRLLAWGRVAAGGLIVSLLAFPRNSYLATRPSGVVKRPHDAHHEPRLSHFSID